MKTVTLNDILLFHKKITKNEYNKHTNDVVVVAITSNLEDKEFGVDKKRRLNGRRVESRFTRYNYQKVWKG
jgi:mRNA-degrading endonuclease toxin of MazEF toxin-antitoxin module